MNKRLDLKLLALTLALVMLAGGFFNESPASKVYADEPSYMQDLTLEQQQVLNDLLNLSTDPNPYTDDPDSVVLPTTGTLLFDESDLFSNALSPMAPDSSYYTSQIVDVYDSVQNGQYYDSYGNPIPFSQAVEFETLQKPSSTYGVQIMLPLSPQMEEGDVVLAMFYLRTIDSTDETGAAMTQFVFERETPNLQHMKFLADGGVPTPGQESEWIKYYLPFEIQGSDVDGSINSHSFLNFRLGYKPQTIQIAGLEVYNYEQTASVDTLPRTVASYDGMNDPNAQWRMDALERIEQNRKDNYSIVLKDDQGNTLDNTALHMEMKQHDFKFGTAVSASKVTSNPSPGTNNDKYIDVLTNSGLFSAVVFENQLKWPKYEENPQLAEDAAKWAKDNNLYARGHTLVWDNFGRVPTDVSDLMDSEPMTTSILQQIQTRVENHIVDEITHLKDEVPEWDVVNEPILNGAMRALLAPLYPTPNPAPTTYTFNPEYESLVHWFQVARNADPNGVLYINDGITSGTLDAFENFLDYMNATNTPYDGIGIQSHFASTGADPYEYYNLLYDLGSTYNKRVAITEYDLNSTDEVFAAKFMRDILIMMFSNEYVDEFIMWGFWDGSHWLNNAPLYNNDWTLKPSGQVYADLVRNLWWTEKNGVTDSSGEYSFRGYKGTYEGTVEYEGKVGRFTVTLNDDSAAVEEAVVDFSVPPIYETFIEDFDDFNKVHAHSANWTVATSSPENKGNDPRRAARSTQTEEHLIYHVEDMDSLELKLYYNVTGEQIELYGSSTDGNYQALNATMSSPSSSGGSWYEVTYTVDDSPADTNYLKIVVPANAHATYTPQLSQLQIDYEVTLHSFVDRLDDFSKVGDKSSHWSLATSHPQYRDGDTSRATRSSQTEEYLIYHVDNMKSAAMDLFYTYAGNDVKLYGSATGCDDYQELTITKSTPVNTGNNWNKVVYRASEIPVGTNYLKIVVPANAHASWTPQIGQVQIDYAHSQGLFVDAMDDFSMVCGKSSNWMTATSTPENKGNDPRRAARSSQTEEHLTYHVENMTGIHMRLYYNVAGNDVELYGSSTDGGYQLLNVTQSTPVSSGPGWNQVDYTVDVLPEDTNYLKIVVPANGHADYTPQIGQLEIEYDPRIGSVVDELDDFSQVSSKSDHWTLATSYPEYRDGDPSRATRSTQTEEYLVYHVENMRSVDMTLFYTYQGNDVELYASSTDGNYQELAVTKTAPVSTGNNWNKVEYSADVLPVGTNYLKIVVPANMHAEWTPQLGRLQINY